MPVDYRRIEKALAPDSYHGRKSIIRHRNDVAKIVYDIVTKTRSCAQVGRDLGVDFSVVTRFRDTFITEEIRRLVMVEHQRAEQEELAEAINEGQDDIQKGLRAIIKDQRDLFQELRQRVGEGKDIEDLVPALAQLLRDQGQSYERLLKSYTALKEKTTVVLSINESPEWCKLQEVLYEVFEQHPDAFEMFRERIEARRLRLE